MILDILIHLLQYTGRPYRTLINFLDLTDVLPLDIMIRRSLCVRYEFILSTFAMLKQMIVSLRVRAFLSFLFSLFLHIIKFFVKQMWTEIQSAFVLKKFLRDFLELILIKALGQLSLEHFLRLFHQHLLSPIMFKVLYLQHSESFSLSESQVE